MWYFSNYWNLKFQKFAQRFKVVPIVTVFFCFDDYLNWLSMVWTWNLIHLFICRIVFSNLPNLSVSLHNITFPSYFLGTHWMTLGLDPMCISVCGRMEKMFLWHLVKALTMEYPRLEKSSWREFCIIFLQFWHLQHQFQIGYHLYLWVNNSLLLFANFCFFIFIFLKTYTRIEMVIHM